MLLSDIETMVRQDLFDPVGANQRWQTSDLDRAIDKAVDRYSQYYPNIAYVDMLTQPFQRTYPYPITQNPTHSQPRIERILYPLQSYGSYFSPPTSPLPTAIAGTGLATGLYQYAVTFLSQGGETTASPLAGVTTTGGNQRVNLSNIASGPSFTSTAGVATNMVIGRNLYRSQVGGNILYLLSTLQDNITTSFIDTSADSALAGKPQPPLVNTSGVMLWPPFERDFAEYSNIFDSTAALAAGGNLVLGVFGLFGQAMTGAATPSFTLKLSSAELPQDNTQVMRIFYATRHQLDANGSTIPEIHRDIIVLGACTYAMESYQVPTNDNFEFQDGSLHDRLDDSKIPLAWLHAIEARRRQFETRLQEIKNQRDFATSARVHWGDIPSRWPRL